MSVALGRLLKGYFRLASSKDYRHDDPGLPPDEAQVTDTIGLLSTRQQIALDEQILSELADALDDDLSPVQSGWYRPRVPVEKCDHVKNVLSRGPHERAKVLTNWAIVIGLARRADTMFTYNRLASAFQFWLSDAFKAVSNRKHLLDQEQARIILDANRNHATGGGKSFDFHTIDVALATIHANHMHWSFTDDDRRTFLAVADSLAQFAHSGKTRTHIATLRDLAAAEPQVALWESEPWAQTIVESLSNLSTNEKRTWTRILGFASTCSLSKPSKQWMAQAQQHVAEVNAEALSERLSNWVRNFIRAPRPSAPQAPAQYSEEGWQQHYAMQGKYLANTAHLVGLIWLTQCCWKPALAPLLADVAEAIAHLPQIAREPSTAIGAAAIKTLGHRDEDDALAQLARLKMRLRWPKLKKVVTKQFDETIARRGLDRIDVEENLVPDFGLRDGVALLPFDGVDAKVTLGMPDKPALLWQHADGKISRLLSAAAKVANPHAAGEAKQTVADIEKMRSAQRTRLDLLMRRPLTWDLGRWRERYLDHGLVGSLARRLIWIVGQKTVIWRDGGLVDVNDRPYVPANDEMVRLWHPAQQTMDEVVAWREALEHWQITQPFKQAFREVYLLTDAERRTATYSNRYAAHIVRAMTLLSLSQVRQWKSGMFGGASSPSFDLVDHGLRAEWWVDVAGDEHTPFGAPLYLATDQVRFVVANEQLANCAGRTALDEPLPLDQVPPLVLSEIMRDVDLFVGVASVGNDPTWQDGGPQGRFVDYWHSYSFGDLTATAQTRKAVLEKVIPRLKIAPRCSFDDKFLIVQGEMRTYKIHLGSGNILMKPNDQYLCIVPARGAAAKGDSTDMFLPFEGDERLSIILSKALMLADDTKIKDSTIISQIKLKS